MKALTVAISTVGGVGELAKLLGVRQNVVSNWKSRGRVPPRYARPIEKATKGAVTRHDIAPEVFGQKK